MFMSIVLSCLVNERSRKFMVRFSSCVGVNVRLGCILFMSVAVMCSEL